MKIINTLFYGMITIFSSTIALGLNTFEIMNKSENPIWVSIFSGGESTSDIVQKVGGKGFGEVAMARQEIDSSKPTKLVIWTQNPGKVALGKKFLVFGEMTLNPKPNYIYEFVNAAGKDILVTFNPGVYQNRGDLYPQTGPIWGILGKTESGLSLKNNITRDNIKLVDDK